MKSPKLQWYRKLGHLYQAFYGFPGSGSYGYGVTKQFAITQARLHYQGHRDQQKGVTA